MLAYEIHVSGAEAEADAARVRSALERVTDEALDPPYLLDRGVRALLLPPGVEWSFGRLREVVGSLRDEARSSTVTLVGIPDDDAELFVMLIRQARILLVSGHVSRCRALVREARAYAEHTDQLAAWEVLDREVASALLQVP